MSDFPKPAFLVNDLLPYEDARAISLSDPYKGSLVKLDCNEATYPPSPFVKKRLIDFIESHPLNWYPDTRSQDLRLALTPYVGYGPEFIGIYNGCDHALETLCRTYLEPGDEAAIFAPSYDNFRVFAETAGGKPVFILARSPFETNVEGLKKVLHKRTKIIYLVNPTNPTGVTYSQEEIEFVLGQAPSSLVVVDEAYHEFWGRTSLALVKKYPNLILTRSFSKAFALAGLRCGYLVSQPSNIQALDKIRNGKNINTLAQIASAAALEDLPYFRAKITELLEIKSRFVKTLQERSIPVVDTPVNFILVKTETPELLKKNLEARGILVRNRSSLPQLEGYLRISIGSSEEMEKILSALETVPLRLHQRNFL